MDLSPTQFRFESEMGYNYPMKNRIVSLSTKIAREYRMEWAVATVVLYLAAIPFTLIVFPDSNLWLGLLILFTGFTASVSTLGDMLISAEDKLKEEENE